MYKNQIQFKATAFFKFLALLLLMSPIRTIAQPSHIDRLAAELKKFPDNITLRLKLANVQLKSGNIDTAQILFAEVAVLANKPDNAKDYIAARINLGRINADKGENVKALGNYQQALTKAEQI